MEHAYLSTNMHQSCIEIFFSGVYILTHIIYSLMEQLTNHTPGIGANITYVFIFLFVFNFILEWTMCQITPCSTVIMSVWCGGGGGGIIIILSNNVHFPLWAKKLYGSWSLYWALLSNRLLRIFSSFLLTTSSIIPCSRTNVITYPSPQHCHRPTCQLHVITVSTASAPAVRHNVFGLLVICTLSVIGETIFTSTN